MRLRYTGTSPDPISFQALGLSVGSGEEFDAPDGAAAGYTARADVVEAAPPSKSPARRAAKPAAPEAPASVPAAAAPDPEAPPEEVPGDVPDDH